MWRVDNHYVCMAQIVAWENSRAFGDATTGFSDTLRMLKVISTERVRDG